MGHVREPLWREILERVQGRHDTLWKEWFDQLEPGGLLYGVMEIRAHTREQQAYLQGHCTKAFTEAAQDATGRLISVRFTVNSDHLSDQEDRIEVDGGRTTEPHGQLLLNADYTFDNFVTGPCNRLAHAAAVAVGDGPGHAYNPLFLHGSVGLGKTHLLQAICQRILAKWPSTRILYLSCESFTNHFIEAIESGALHNFRYRYRYVDVLAIDDIQFLAGRERSQEEFFHTFNTLYQTQRQLILSADCPPKEIPSLEDRLTSRFNWGLVARIDQPCFETRLAILQKKAKVRQVKLPEKVIQLIASRIETNTRELEGAILKVAALSEHYNRAIDEAIALEALGDMAPSTAPEVRLPDIIGAVTRRYGVKLTDLQGKKRTKSITLPRQVCMYLARELTSMSLEELGGFFGGRDHTTVLHAYRTINNQRDDDAQLARVLEELSAELSYHRSC